MRGLFTIIFIGSFYILNAQYFENEIIFDTEIHSEVVRTLEDNQQNIVVCGYSFDTTYQFSGFLLKITPGFDTTTCIIQHDTADILFTDIIVTPENNYFLIGGIGHDTGYSYQLDHIAIYIFDDNLNLLTEKSYKMPDDYNYPKLYLWQAENGNIYAAGGESTNSTRLLLLKFDQNGDTLLTNFPYLLNAYIFSVLPKFNNISGFYAFGQGMGFGGMRTMELHTDINYKIEKPVCRMLYFIRQFLLMMQQQGGLTTQYFFFQV